MIEVQYQPQEHPYKLSHAILFYRNNQGTLATLHKIRNKQFMSGKSLDPAELEELLHTPNQQRHMNYLPAQVIAYSQNEILWFEKSAVRPIYFNVPKEEKERLFLNRISGKKVIWPSLLFKISRNSISCWALKSNRHPLPTTQLYFAPFTNLFSDQKFCLPNAVSPGQPAEIRHPCRRHHLSGTFFPFVRRKGEHVLSGRPGSFLGGYGPAGRTECDQKFSDEISASHE